MPPPAFPPPRSAQLAPLARIRQPTPGAVGPRDDRAHTQVLEDVRRITGSCAVVMTRRCPQGVDLEHQLERVHPFGPNRAEIHGQLNDRCIELGDAALIGMVPMILPLIRAKVAG